MNTRRHALCASLVVLLAIVGSAGAGYIVTDLGTIHGGHSSGANSVNNGTQVVGSGAGPGGEGCAVLFDPTGGGANIDLGNLGCTESCRALSINDNGQIVGAAHLSPGFTDRACLFDPTGGGNNANLGILSGYQQSQADSINNSGVVVGHSQNYGPGWYQRSRACRFYATGAAPMDLGTLSGYEWGEARSVNDSNMIVGGVWHDYGLGYYDTRAVLFDPTGGGDNRDLGTLPGYSLGDAYSVNDRGQIVGWVGNGAVDHRACLFDANGGPNTDLGSIDGYQYSNAMSINNNGQIVGVAWNSSGQSRAVLFDPTGGGHNVAIDDLLPPSSGWTLRCAYCINDQGVIVGTGLNPHGEVHAFLARELARVSFNTRTGNLTMDTRGNVFNGYIIYSPRKEFTGDANLPGGFLFNDNTEELIASQFGNTLEGMHDFGNRAVRKWLLWNAAEGRWDLDDWEFTYTIEGQQGVFTGEIEIEWYWPGDVDLDGDVDAWDIQRILACNSYNNGSGWGWECGDFTGDTLVNWEDIQMILDHGRYAQGQERVLMGLVPEPAAMSLLTLGGLALIRRRCR